MSRRFKSLVDFHQRAEKEYQDALKRTQARAKPSSIIPLAVMRPHYYAPGSRAKQHAWLQTGFPDVPWDGPASIGMPPEAWRRRRRTAEDESEPAEGAAKRVRTAAACTPGIRTNRNVATVEDWAAGAWRELEERIDEALASGVMVGGTLVCKSVRRCRSPLAMPSSGKQVCSAEPMNDSQSPSPFLHGQQTQSTTSLILANRPPSSCPLPTTTTSSAHSPSRARLGPASQPRPNSIDLDLIVAELLGSPGSRRYDDGTGGNRVGELRSDRVRDLTRSTPCDSRGGHLNPQPLKELKTKTRATFLKLAASPKSPPHTPKSSLDISDTIHDSRLLRLDNASSRTHSDTTRSAWLPQDPQLPAPHCIESPRQPNSPETSATLIDTERNPDALMVNGPGWLDDLDPNLPSLGGADLFGDEEYTWIKECV
ncbi:hypothetical protein BC937DRAFT_90037 [Endogone sp. FLAS-F59071]|nr:hypothetical protein BC937DRAFT_90037 [Endogone sp. FLAS-F59071]|eukprot:RUS22206.1 hypothetical protein BC937DRAFT_90037 [Endogone sp. FLAS-F59071]